MRKEQKINAKDNEPYKIKSKTKKIGTEKRINRKRLNSCRMTHKNRYANENIWKN